MCKHSGIQECRLGVGHASKWQNGTRSFLIKITEKNIYLHIQNEQISKGSKTEKCCKSLNQMQSHTKVIKKIQFK